MDGQISEFDRALIAHGKQQYIENIYMKLVKLELTVKSQAAFISELQNKVERLEHERTDK